MPGAGLCAPGTVCPVQSPWYGVGGLRRPSKQPTCTWSFASPRWHGAVGHARIDQIRKIASARPWRCDGPPSHHTFCAARPLSATLATSSTTAGGSVVSRRSSLDWCGRSYKTRIFDKWPSFGPRCRLARRAAVAACAERTTIKALRRRRGATCVAMALRVAFDRRQRATAHAAASRDFEGRGRKDNRRASLSF